MSLRVFDVPMLEDEAAARDISAALRPLPGIIGIQVDVDAKQIAVDFDSALINEAQVMEAIRDTGYEPE